MSVGITQPHFTCLVSSFPPSNITWRFKGQELNDNNKYNFTNEGKTLQVEKLAPVRKHFTGSKVTNATRTGILSFAVLNTLLEIPTLLLYCKHYVLPNGK